MKIRSLLLSTTLVVLTGLTPALAQSSSSDAMAKVSGAKDDSKLAETFRQIGVDGPQPATAAGAVRAGLCRLPSLK